MADRVLPLVRLMFLCDTAVIDLADMSWELKNPWLDLTLPTGVRFPFRHDKICVYAQLTGGLGSFDVHVEMRQLMDNGRRTIGAGTSMRIEFPTNQRLFVSEVVFEINRVPFREAGLYEFYVASDEGEELEGPSSVIRVLAEGEGL